MFIPSHKLKTSTTSISYWHKMKSFAVDERDCLLHLRTSFTTLEEENFLLSFLLSHVGLVATLTAWIWKAVCVCVWERERKRDRSVRAIPQTPYDKNSSRFGFGCTKRKAPLSKVQQNVFKLNIHFGNKFFGFLRELILKMASQLITTFSNKPKIVKMEN